MSIALGLDISTSCTGWCVIHQNGTQNVSCIELGFIPLSKLSGSYSKAQEVLEALQMINGQHKIDVIYIEENLQTFKTGLSSAKTLATLARFNGIVSYLSEQVFEIPPIFLNVNSARKSIGIKLIKKRNGGKPTKEQVFDWVDKDLTQIEHAQQWPMKTMKSGPRKGQVILDPRTYDMTDAYVIARAGLLT
jgi:Holliday junction resolvasome RuvABC endonuclease subunit